MLRSLALGILHWIFYWIFQQQYLLQIGICFEFTTRGFRLLRLSVLNIATTGCWTPPSSAVKWRLCKTSSVSQNRRLTWCSINTHSFIEVEPSRVRRSAPVAKSLTFMLNDDDNDSYWIAIPGVHACCCCGWLLLLLLRLSGKLGTVPQKSQAKSVRYMRATASKSKQHQ